MTKNLKLNEKVIIRIYRLTTFLLAPVLPFFLRRRLKRCKEHPHRWSEKLGFPSEPRPPGKLIWLHAVGLGEVLALRAIISTLSACSQELQFLVTSTSLTSAETLAKNLPTNTIHQFLPLDSPQFATRFFNHWQPDLAIWSEQDLWPGLVHEAASRDIPQALINARINDASENRRKKAKTLFSSAFNCLSLISAQDQKTATALFNLGVRQKIRLDGSLKPHCPALVADSAELEKMKTNLSTKIVWLAASCEPEDETIAIEAQKKICAEDGNYTLILAPRHPARAAEILQKLSGLNVKVRSKHEIPDTKTQVYLADSFAEMGLWYRLSSYALIGGTFDETEGHNPWEALQLGCAVMHGPRYANFLSDFESLVEARASFSVFTSDEISTVVRSNNALEYIENYRRLKYQMNSDLVDLSQKLIKLLKV